MLKLALPSKGALADGTNRLFDRALLPVLGSTSNRSYSAALRGLPDVEVTLARADEIPTLVSDGRVHAGVTGLDLVRESESSAEHSLRVVLPDLDFGHADLVIAVPKFWIDVENIEDLVDVAREHRFAHRSALRVATKFDGLTRNFFAKIGLTDYRIVHSAGATEVAPKSGTADIVIDLTSTGATIDSNGLKTISGGTLLASTACLVASTRSELWNDRTTVSRFIRVVGLIEASLLAERAYSVEIVAQCDVEGAVEAQLHSLLRGICIAREAEFVRITGVVGDSELDNLLSVSEGIKGECSIRSAPLIVGQPASQNLPWLV